MPHPRPSHRLAPGLLLATVLVAAGLSTPTAQAAPYSVWSCRGPDGAPVATTAWRGGGSSVPGGPGTVSALTDTCASGGALTAALFTRAAGDLNQHDDLSGYRLAVPATTRLLGIRVWLSAAKEDSGNTGYEAGFASDDEVTPVAPGVLVGCPGLGPCSFGSPVDPLGPANFLESTTPAGAATLVARCGQSSTGSQAFDCFPVTPPPNGSVASVSLYRSEARFDGGAAPVVGTPSGSLVDAASVRGSGHIEADASDLEGGVQSTALLIDGSVVATRAAGGGCAEPYVLPDPCPQRTVASFGFDTTPLPPGDHTARLRAVDASGAITDGPPATVRVLAPVPPPPPPVTVTTPAPPPPPAAINEPTLELTRTRIRATRTVEVRGRVGRRDGRDPGAVRVQIATRRLGAPRASFRDTGAVTTAANGTFRFRGRATSSELRFAVDGDGRRTASDTVEIVTPLRLSLQRVDRIVRNGGRVTLRGELDGAGKAAKGTLVVVQAIVGRRWTAVDTVRVGEEGRVRWRYRFERSPRPANYRFRFQIPERDGLPFRRETSPVRIVRVRP